MMLSIYGHFPTIKKGQVLIMMLSIYGYVRIEDVVNNRLIQI